LTTPTNQDVKYRSVLAGLLPKAATDDELAALRTEAEAARAALAAAKQRFDAMQKEVEKARAASAPRPELAHAAATLKAAEIEARVRDLPGAKEHARRATEAQAALAAAEAQRQEAELLLPALTTVLDELKAEATRAGNRATDASVRFGSALMCRLARDEFVPRVAEVLAVERKLATIAEEWWCAAVYESTVSFGSHRWTLNDLMREAERADASMAASVTA